MSTARPVLDLVIFDCDGVLVDSEVIVAAAMAEALTEQGLVTTADEVMERYIGRSASSARPLIEKALGRALPDSFYAALRARTYATFERELAPVAGVVEVLGVLRTPCCVASSGTPEKIRFTLGRTGLLDRFVGRIFSGADVARGKPAPDLFLHAARSLGADPARCAVVEDTAVGVEAARAAGMLALGYAGRTRASRLAAAGARTFATMRQLPALLAEAGAVLAGSAAPD